MYPHNVRAIQCCRSHSRGCGKYSIGVTGLSQERLPRGTHQNGIVQGRQFSQPANDFQILFLALAKTKTRIYHNPRPVNTGQTCTADSCIQFAGNSNQRILHGRQLAPRFGRPPHVVENQPGIAAGCNFGQTWVVSQTAWIVEDFHAILQGAFGNLRFIGVERKRNPQVPLQSFQHWNQPLPLLICGNPLRSGAG